MIARIHTAASWISPSHGRPSVTLQRLAVLMKRDRGSWLGKLAAQCVLGGAGLFVITFLCFRLDVSLASTAFAYLTLVSLLSLVGCFVGSVVLSLAAVACLNYFFTVPLLSFQVEYSQDILALAAFLTSSLLVTALVARSRKTAEDAEASRQALVDTIPALTWTALPDGARDFHSRRWMEFSGLSAGDSAGDGWNVMYHPDDRAKVLEKWRHAVKAGGPFEIEARGLGATGEYRALLLRAEPLRDSRGNIVKWFGVTTDIEDLRRATEALRESETQWREVFEHNPVMYFMIDPAGTVLSVNSFGAAQLGYTVDELVGASVFKVFFEEDREAVRRSVGVCLETLGRSNSWEIRKLRKDGTVIWVRENAKAVLRPGNQRIVLIACEDITERRRTEDALRQSEMYLAEAQRLSQTGSFGWHVASGQLVWSAETFRIFGIEPTVNPSLELVLQRAHPDDRMALAQFFQHVSQQGDDWTNEHRLLMPDGCIKHLRVTAHADKSGGLKFAGAVMDVTAIKKAQDETLQARSELARVARLTALGELTAAIAHEVNQPLSGVINSGNACLRWLEGDPPDLEAARRSVQRMIADGGRAAEVINRIRAMVSKSGPKKEQLDINDVVADVVAMVRSEISGSLRTELSIHLPLVTGDRIQLQQVILNLLLNASEAVRAAPGGPGVVGVRSTMDDADNVIVSVTDSGPGLEETKLEEVFQAFYTTKPDGMGMGLAISRSIVEAHGGRLWAAPNNLRGATFQFTIPAGSRINSGPIT